MCSFGIVFQTFQNMVNAAWYGTIVSIFPSYNNEKDCAYWTPSQLDYKHVMKEKNIGN